MSGATASRLMRYGSQLIAGLAIGFVLGGTAREARAEDAASSLRGRQQSTDRLEQHNSRIRLAFSLRADSIKSFRVLTDPRRLDEVQRGCKVNAPWATEALCREAAQAIRLRFRGAGVRYTPPRVDPFPSHPAIKPTPREKVPEGKPRAQAAPRAPSRIL